jgi:CheY-like chemotaxis protein
VLLSLIEDVLDLSRFESGELRLDAAPFGLDELLFDGKALFGVQARQLGIAMQWHCIGGDLRLLGDRQRLRQVLMNLVGNALKFTERGEVAVRARAEPGDGGFDCTIEVEDSGCGVPAGQRERIFEPFVQVDDSRTRRHGGAGLGLAISNEIVRAMGGTIECLPGSSGSGARFRVWLRLPAAPTGCEAPAPARTAGAGAELRARVLLVEDSPIGRRVATKILEKIGCEVTTATNGCDAIERFAGGTFDLVLMDCQMPIMDGPSAAEAIRRVDPKTPIVALTAHALASDEQRCRDAGMNDYVTKPVTLTDLRTIVQRWSQPTG